MTYTGSASRINGSASFDLTGERGAYSFSVVNNELLTAARDRINQFSHETGITATASGNSLTFRSVDYGTDAIVDIDVTSGTFNTAGTTAGTDAIVTINGESISSSDIDGNRVMYNRNGLSAAIELTAGYSGAISTMTVSDSRVAKFALTPDPNRLNRFAINSVSSSAFSGISGNLMDIVSGGSTSGLSTNTSEAIRIVDEALRRLTVIEGQVDGFANATVSSASSLISALETNLEDSLESINGIDEDEETTLLTRAQTLGSNSIAALSLLQEQRTSVMSLLQLLAGTASYR